MAYGFAAVIGGPAAVTAFLFSEIGPLEWAAAAIIAGAIVAANALLAKQPSRVKTVQREGRRGGVPLSFRRQQDLRFGQPGPRGAQAGGRDTCPVRPTLVQEENR